jgi:hypothetical protein
MYETFEQYRHVTPNSIITDQIQFISGSRTREGDERVSKVLIGADLSRKFTDYVRSGTNPDEIITIEDPDLLTCDSIIERLAEQSSIDVFINLNDSSVLPICRVLKILTQVLNISAIVRINLPLQHTNDVFCRNEFYRDLDNLCVEFTIHLSHIEFSQNNHYIDTLYSTATIHVVPANFHIRQARIGELRSLRLSRANLIRSNPNCTELKYQLTAHESFLKKPNIDYEAVRDGYLKLRINAFSTKWESSDMISSSVNSSFRKQIFKGEFNSFINLNYDKVETASETLRKYGYYELKTQLAPELIAQLRDYTDLSNAQSHIGRHDIDLNLKSKRIHRLMLLDSFFLDVAADYFGCTPIAESMLLARTFPNPNDSEDVLSAQAQMFHSDCDRLKWLKVFIYLTDVTESSGAHCYLPGSHLIKPREGRISDDEASELGSIIDIVGPSGTVFIADTRAIHKGNPLIAGLREILQLQYSTSLFGEKVSPVFCSRLELSNYRRLVSRNPRVFSNWIFS